MATYAFGWWTVPAVALACGLFMNREGSPIRYATLCSAAGWLSLLLIDAARGPVGELAKRLGGVMGLSSAALVVCTLLFPALLAWSASSIGVAARGRIFRPSEVALGDA